MVINNLTWTIKYDEIDEKGTLGITDFTTLEIKIKPNLKEEVEDSTILHELVHALCESTSYMYCRDKISYEQLCEFVGVNFKTLAKLYEEAKEELKGTNYKEAMERFQSDL